jgi:predicted nucleic acid-binding Zn ribbon protein
MANHKKQWSDWLLTRERFHIADRRPPSSCREERSIGTILSDVLKIEPVEEALPQVLIDRWPIVIGVQIAKHTSPARFRNGILYVYADHPGWLTEIRRLPKTHLLKKIASIPDVPEITDIRFQLDPTLRTKGFRK